MTKLYCLCQITGDVPARARDSQGFGPLDDQCFGAPNRWGLAQELDGETQRPVLLQRAMEVVKNGLPQMVRNNSSDKVPPNNWPRTKEEVEAGLAALQDVRRHYPNVDMYRCPNCGAIIVRE
jgi:hypothetical protein